MPVSYSGNPLKLMRKNLLVLLLCASFAISVHARDVRIVADSIPACTANYLYESENFRISQFEYESGGAITFIGHLGYFNWGASSSNFAIANNSLEDNRRTFFAFDASDFLVYGGPDTIGEWFPSTPTSVQLGFGYKTVSAFDDMIFMLRGGSLYKYRVGGEPVMLRNDVLPRISQQVVDADFNFIYVSNPSGGGTWDADAVVVVDSTGWIRYRFTFNPPLDAYNLTSLFMVNDSLFFISGNLNQTFGRSLVHVALDCDTYTATPVRISSAGFLTHLFSCSPGRLVAGCAPNVEIAPGTTSTGDVPGHAISLFPNPARNDLHVAGEISALSGFAIYGVDGKCVKRGVIEDTPARIDVADLVPGTYVLNIAGAGVARFLKVH
jgi:hypothetical protein